VKSDQKAVSQAREHLRGDFLPILQNLGSPYFDRRFVGAVEHTRIENMRAGNAIEVVITDLRTSHAARGHTVFAR
jgi:hypothetical protein